MQQTERKPLFDLGQLVATPGALAALEKSGQSPMGYLSRHVKGDWGELSEDDRKENQFSVEKGFRILSSYKTNAGETTLRSEACTIHWGTIASKCELVLERGRSRSSRSRPQLFWLGPNLRDQLLHHQGIRHHRATSGRILQRRRHDILPSLFRDDDAGPPALRQSCGRAPGTPKNVQWTDVLCGLETRRFILHSVHSTDGYHRGRVLLSEHSVPHVKYALVALAAGKMRIKPFPILSGSPNNFGKPHLTKELCRIRNVALVTERLVNRDRRFGTFPSAECCGIVVGRY